MAGRRHPQPHCTAIIMKRINTRHIKAKCTYTVGRLATLCGVRSNTVHEWVKQGLPRMEGSYPFTFWGQEVIDFLNARQQRNKMKLALDEFRCSKCRCPRKARDRLADLQICTSKTGNLKVRCEQCSTRICKIISLKNRDEIEKLLIVYAPQDLTLVQPTHNRANRETKGAENHAAI